MSIDPSGLPLEYSNAMATVITIYAIAIFGTVVLAVTLLCIARVMDSVRAKRLSSQAGVERDDKYL